MRPRRLAMENFGPYRARTELDFSALASLFLVCGKTGSGKTTIFDAIAYALYGKVPGARAGLEQQLWSHYASPGDRPSVEFEFELGDSVYLVQRWPPYSRQKRGGGLTEVPSEAILHRLGNGDGDGWEVVAEHPAPVGEQVKLLMGLTLDEFQKVILLPQGEFQKFLEMGSKDRGEVLEKLFPVDLHGKVTEIAVARAQEADVEAKRIDTELARLAAEAGEEHEARLDALISACAEAEKDLAAAMGELSTAEADLAMERDRAARAVRARAAFSRFARATEGAQEDAARLRRIDRARAAARVLPVLSEHERLAAALADAAAKLAGRREIQASLETRRAVIDAASLGVEALKKELEALNAEVSRLGHAAEAWKRALEASSNFVKAGSGAEAAKRMEDEAAARAASLRAEYASVLPSPAEEKAARFALDSARKDEAGAGARLSLARRLETLSAESDARAIAAAKKEAEAGEALSRLEMARAAFDAAEVALAGSHAARLASSLEPGIPCPVCGSTEHPAPAFRAAAPQDEAIDLADAARLAQLRKALDEATVASATAIERRTAAAERLQESVDTLKSIRAEADRESVLPDAAECALVLEARNRATAEAEAALSTLEGRREKAALLAAATVSADAALDAARKAHSHAREELSAAGAAQAAAAAQAGGTDPGPLLDIALADLAAMQSRKAGLEAEIEDWRTSWNEAAIHLSNADDLYRQAAEAASGSSPRLAEALAAEGFREGFHEGFREGIAEESFDAVAACRASLLPPRALAALEELSAGHAAELAAANAEYEALKADLPPEGAPGPDTGRYEEALAAIRAKVDALRAVADARHRERMDLRALVDRMEALRADRATLEAGRGRIIGLADLLKGGTQGRRIAFKSFVLAMYFRAVVARASVRLSEMSDGRYALKADEGSNKGYMGLGVSVLDAYTGRSRPTGTLSGGERFLTSISLALGLADTIRARSGGVNLDAVFIDEGFGSLDDETLDRAVTVLERIRGARTIGIVSHVAELRSRIPSRIEVEKGPAGSTIRVVG